MFGRAGFQGRAIGRGGRGYHGPFGITMLAGGGPELSGDRDGRLHPGTGVTMTHG